MRDVAMGAEMPYVALRPGERDIPGQPVACRRQSGALTLSPREPLRQGVQVGVWVEGRLSGQVCMFVHRGMSVCAHLRACMYACMCVCLFVVMHRHMHVSVHSSGIVH